MFPSLTARDCFRTGLAVVHFLRDALPGPGSSDAREEGGDVVRAFAELGGVEDDVVVVEVETEWDVELFTYGQEVVDGP